MGSSSNPPFKKECYLLSDKLESMEICLRVNDTLCIKMIESIPRRLVAVITKGGEQVYKEYFQNKFDFDET